MVVGDKPYTTVDIVRRLAGNPDPQDIPDSDILTAINYSDSHVDSETAKSDSGWLKIDNSYPIVQEASSYFAASWVIDHYYDDALKSDRHYQKALDLCMTIRESSASAFIVASSQYQSYPLNPKGKLYRSLPGSSDTSNRDAVFGDDSDVTGPP
jgi:hypothetical protein